MNSMKIKFFGQEITINYHDSLGLSSRQAQVMYTNNTMTFYDVYIDFNQCLFHELAHFYLYFCGYISQPQLNMGEEVFCDKVGMIVSALINENGSNIISEIQEFIESEKNKENKFKEKIVKRNRKVKNES